jgi:hypothetical protein
MLLKERHTIYLDFPSRIFLGNKVIKIAITGISRNIFFFVVENN